jgi:hypothetical protein
MVVNYLNRFELIKSLQPRIGVEVGVCDGIFSAQLLTIPSLHRLYLVDQWKHVTDSPYSKDNSNVDQGGHAARERQVRARFAYNPAVIIIKGDSADSARHVDVNCDFVFIDAAHDFDSALRDMVSWSGHTRNLLCHDYFNCPPVYEVERAVQIFLRMNGWWTIAGVTQEPAYQTVHLIHV